VESADAQRLLDIGAIPITRGRRTTPLTEVLATYGDTTRSDLERLFLELCERRGIPKPRVNVSVEGYEVDFLWPEHRLIAETDGYRHHGTKAAHQRDRTRDAELLVAGYRTVRFTYEDITQRPHDVAATLRALLV
jgi:very-short-patch-repair endonuclease